ncbi:MAG: leucyl/phenylalanyl-tRNA--protein transferase [Caulobacteraceae bacterium]|nr:leucyl/phenylalanyl-tRNA--protein transferase [Caulobacteraceae bacterium]
MRDEGVFSVEDLLACYRMGVFPMGEAREDARVFLVDPKRRGVIEPRNFHLSHRLARTVRSDRYEVRVDTAFDDVVEACAIPAPGRDETWINAPIQVLYGALFRRGQAHSVEAWRSEQLVGGLYGVTLGGVFFGESMFSTARDASKVELVHLIARLRAGGFRLLDCQFMTEHLAQFGTVEINRTDYHVRLDAALAVEGDFHALPGQVSGAQALQAISQAS